MSLTQGVQLHVYLRTDDKFTAITRKNKLVDGTIESIDSAGIKVKNVAGIVESIKDIDIIAMQLKDFDRSVIKVIEDGITEINYGVSHPQINSENIWPGTAETIGIPSTPPAAPEPITVKPYTPPEPDSIPWIWDRYNNPGYMEGSNGQQLQPGYVRSASTTYALRFTFEAEETIEESTETVKVKRYTYRLA
ncbi:hypothetical protein CFN16_25685 [Pseudomonas fluorescens]|uniref:Uncharacterized protein n=1 Tax=Pseudomonas fluorescens TaxID=294 RepID=A0A345V3U5_PSEFL|nr:hypothetical protein [Pseudomonas fluorescens]AXJ07397.1 hypothetical protein CFN16_25685 [Pseudomonas fluorescens]